MPPPQMLPVLAMRVVLATAPSIGVIGCQTQPAPCDLHSMWLLTPRGFFSVVAHADEPSCVLVRARVRADLESLRDVAGPFEVHETRDRDYRFRAVLDRTAWSTALVLMAAEIDYPNFKNAVAEQQGYERADVYARVWFALTELQT